MKTRIECCRTEDILCTSTEEVRVMKPEFNMAFRRMKPEFNMAFRRMKPEFNMAFRRMKTEFNILEDETRI